MRVLVIGTGRSGKSWIAGNLARVAHASYLDEPDNHFKVPFAYRAKRHLGQRSYPDPDFVRAREVRQYAALWRHAFMENPHPPRRRREERGDALARLGLAGGAGRAGRLLRLHRAVASSLAGEEPSVRLAVVERLARPVSAASPSEHVVICSAYAHLSADWISRRCGAGVVVVRRDPAGLLGTWAAQGWLRSYDLLGEVSPDVVRGYCEREHLPLPPEDARPETRAMWLLGFLTHNLRRLVAEHPDWALVDYEESVIDPQAVFARLLGHTGLPQYERPIGERELESAAGRRQSCALYPRLSDAWRSELHDVLTPFNLGDWSPSQG